MNLWQKRMISAVHGDDEMAVLQAVSLMLEESELCQDGSTTLSMLQHIIDAIGKEKSPRGIRYSQLIIDISAMFMMRLGHSGYSYFRSIFFTASISTIRTRLVSERLYLGFNDNALDLVEQVHGDVPFILESDDARVERRIVATTGRNGEVELLGLSWNEHPDQWPVVQLVPRAETGKDDLEVLQNFC